MIHYTLLLLAGVIRFTRKWLLRISLVAFLLALNVATLVSNKVYDVLERLVWGTVEMVSDQLGDRRPKSRAEMEADAVRARAEADAASADAKKAKVDADLAKTETGRTKVELDAAKADAVRAKADLDVAKAKAKRVQTQLDELNVRNRALSVDLDTKNQRVAELVTDIDMSRQNQKKAMYALGKLKSRIMRSVKRNASSEALEAVPFVGTAVFLGLVAYEVNDSCEQLRELESLDASLRGKEPGPVNESMCVMSYEDLVATFTGKDRAYAKCVSDRIALNDLDPPSCAGYDPALPEITDSSLSDDEVVPQLPVIE